MSTQVWRLVHDAAVVVFLGNIVTGLFWAAHACRTRDLRVVAAVFDGLTRSDSRIALPCVPVILVSGVALAGRAHLPLLGTGWILWASVSFALSGVLFALRVGPLQKSIAALARRGGNDDGIWHAVSGVYRRWMAHAVLSIATATIPLGLMVLKPSLPRMTRPAAVTTSGGDSGTIVARGTSAGAVPILLIYREELREGAADRYPRLEEHAAAMCRSLRCPNPYLATESLDAPNEVWFLNGFRSAAHEQAVARAYTGDRTLTAALERISTSKANLTHAPGHRASDASSSRRTHTHHGDSVKGVSWWSRPAAHRIEAPPTWPMTGPGSF